MIHPSAPFEPSAADSEDTRSVFEIAGDLLGHMFRQVADIWPGPWATAALIILVVLIVSARVRAAVRRARAVDKAAYGSYGRPSAAGRKVDRSGRSDTSSYDGTSALLAGAAFDGSDSKPGHSHSSHSHSDSWSGHDSGSSYGGGSSYSSDGGGGGGGGGE